MVATPVWMSIRGLLFSTVLACLLLVSGGCGGDEDGGGGGDAGGSKPAASGPGDPCRLLNKSEVEGVLGESAETPKKNSAPDGTLEVCTWTGAGGDPRNTVQVSVGPAGKQQYKGLKGIATDPKDISGIGDQAYVASGGRELTAVKGDTLLQVRSADANKTKPLAQKAVARLK